MNAYQMIAREAALRSGVLDNAIASTPYRFSSNVKGSAPGSSGSVQLNAASQVEAMERLRREMPYHEVVPLHGPATLGGGFFSGV